MKSIMAILFILAVFITSSGFQGSGGARTSKIRSWAGSVPATGFQHIVPGSISATFFNYDIYNGSTGTLWANIRSGDTSAASNGYSGYIPIPSQTVWTFEMIAEDTVWLKSSSGTLTGIVVVKY